MKYLQHLLVSCALATVPAVTAAIDIYQNNFDAGVGPTAAILGPANTITVSTGQLVMTTAGGGDHAGITLGPEQFAGPNSSYYPGVLKLSVGIVNWAFNVSNEDGANNHGFQIALVCNNPDPYQLSSVGYALRGGGLAGNRMILTRFNAGMGGSNNVVVDIAATNGLGTLPDKGSFRIAYDPSTDLWNVYGQTGNSYADPTSVASLLGSGTDSTYANGFLPYFSLTTLGSGVGYFDNVSIAVVPEPSASVLIVVGSILCAGFVKRRKGR
jgi:hypothetical protein